MGFTRRRGVVLLAALLVAGSCGADPVNDAASAAEGETTESAGDEPEAQASGELPDPPEEPAPALTATWRGVTEESVRLGVALIDTDALEAFNVDLGFGPLEAAIRAWTDFTNSLGGVHGRSVELVFDRFLPVGSESSYASCARLIEDREVFMVTGTYLDDNPLCVTELYETPYFGLTGLNDERQERSLAPYVSVQMDEDRQYRHSIATLLDDGVFAGRRVALWWAEPERRLAEEVVLPQLVAAGVDVVARAELPAMGTDTAASDAAGDSIMARFGADGAELLVDLSGVVTFARAVERSGLDADLVFLSAQILTPDLLSGAGFDAGVLSGAVGVTVAFPTREEWVADEVFVECIDIYNASDPEEPVDLATVELSTIVAFGSACRPTASPEPFCSRRGRS